LGKCLKKSSSEELLHQIRLIRTRRFKFVEMKSLGSQWPHPRGINFYIVKYWELLKKSSQEPQDQFQPKLVGNMLGGWGFRFVQIKSLGSCMAPPQGLKLLHSNK